MIINSPASCSISSDLANSTNNSNINSNNINSKLMEECNNKNTNIFFGQEIKTRKKFFSKSPSNSSLSSTPSSPSPSFSHKLSKYNDFTNNNSSVVQNENNLSMNSKSSILNINSGKMAPLCSCCNMAIEEKYLFKLMESYWHEDCLRCSQCGIGLKDSCFSKNGLLFCKDDYFRNFGTRCNTCFELIGSNELVMRIDSPPIQYDQNNKLLVKPPSSPTRQLYYHLNCFKCLVCEKLLKKGDEYLLRSEGIYCKNDLKSSTCTIGTKLLTTDTNNNINNSSFTSSPASSTSSLSTTSIYSTLTTTNNNNNNNNLYNSLINNNNNNSSNQFCSNNKIPLTNNSNSSFNSFQSEEDNSLENNDCLQKKLINQNIYAQHGLQQQQQNLNSLVIASQQQQTQQRTSKPSSRRPTKRPRTILNALQRYDFREAFKQSQKPCRKVRESLADKTGLSVRVVQVWFQNERAKVKKMQRRQQQISQQQQNGGTGLMGDQNRKNGNRKKNKSKSKKDKNEDSESLNNNDDSSMMNDSDDENNSDMSDYDDEDDDVDDDDDIDEINESDLSNDESDDEQEIINNSKNNDNNENSNNKLIETTSDYLNVRSTINNNLNNLEKLSHNNKRNKLTLSPSDSNSIMIHGNENNISNLNMSYPIISNELNTNSIGYSSSGYIETNHFSMQQMTPSTGLITSNGLIEHHLSSSHQLNNPNQQLIGLQNQNHHHQQQHQQPQQINPIDHLYSMQNAYFCS